MRLLTFILLLALASSETKAENAPSVVPTISQDKVCDYVANLPKNSINDYVLRRGFDDFTGNGIAEYLRKGLTGTMGGDAPCLSKSNDDSDNESCKQLKLNIGMRRLWGFGKALLPYDGRYYVLYATDKDLRYPQLLGQILPEKSVQPVCYFTNQVTEHFLGQNKNLCLSLKEKRDIIPIEFNLEHGLTSEKLAMHETSPEKAALIDFDNDGLKEPIVKISHSSGHGRGCDYVFYALLDKDMKELDNSSKSLLLKELQETNDLGCKNNDPKWFERDGIIHFEDKPRGYPDQPQTSIYEYHVINHIRDGEVINDCSGFFQVTTKATDKDPTIE